jgi:hypothetical protein
MAVSTLHVLANAGALCVCKQSTNRLRLVNLRDLALVLINLLGVLRNPLLARAPGQGVMQLPGRTHVSLQAATVVCMRHAPRTDASCTSLLQREREHSLLKMTLNSLQLQRVAPVSCFGAIQGSVTCNMPHASSRLVIIRYQYPGD